MSKLYKLLLTYLLTYIVHIPFLKPLMTKTADL